MSKYNSLRFPFYLAQVLGSTGGLSGGIAALLDCQLKSHSLVAPRRGLADLYIYSYTFYPHSYPFTGFYGSFVFRLFSFLSVFSYPVFFSVCFRFLTKNNILFYFCQFLNFSDFRLLIFQSFHCPLYTFPSPRDLSTFRMPSSA